MRLYHIEFGLPHSFHADEPEFGELAIRYTYELKSIIAESAYYKFIPISYVYGTVPTYFYTVATMLFSKIANLLSIGFDKTTIYVFLRSLTAIVSMSIIFFSAYLYKVLFKVHAGYKFGLICIVFLTALNWKLIVHAHYLNADIILTILLTASYVVALLYINGKNEKLSTIVLGILLGLAMGTKVTALLTLPLYLWLFILRKRPYGMLVFLFVIAGTFIISNPFSFAFASDFIYRVFTLSVKENGMVFDSHDPGLFKYIFALVGIVTPVTIPFVLVALRQIVSKRENVSAHIFLLGTIAIYLLFYSASSRRVDRWLLPITPIVLVYATYGITLLKDKLHKPFMVVCMIGIFMSYLYFPFLLLTQYARYTPKAAAYIWMRDNTNALAKKYVVTEEGLDPINKLPNSTVRTYQVYESLNAHLSFPPDPFLFDYIVLSSRPMKNFKKNSIKNKYPLYTQRWDAFEQTVSNPKYFILLNKFELPKPDLINVSDVYIYERVKAVN